MEIYVVVSSSNGPGDFWVLKHDYLACEEEYKDLISSIGNKESESVDPEDLESGQILLAKPEIMFNDKNYYRIKLLEPFNVNAWRVLYLDTGKISTSRIEDMRVSVENPYIRLLEPKANHCKLKGSENITSEASKRLFNFFVANRRRFLIEVIERNEDYDIVDLMTIDKDVNFYVSHYINKITTDLNVEEIDTQEIKEMEFSKSTFVKVKCVVSLSEIYMIPVDMEDDEKIMKMEMKHYYDTNELNFTKASRGMICVVKTEAEWIRAEVLSPPNIYKEVEVQDIDNGIVFKVLFDDLFELVPTFYVYPRFAKRFSLHGIESIINEEAAIDTLQKRLICCKETLEMNIVEDHDCELLVYYQNVQFNITDSLRHHGYITTKELKKPISVYCDKNQNTLPNFKDNFILHPVDVLQVQSHQYNPNDFFIIFKEFKGAVDLLFEILSNYDLKAFQTTCKVGDKCLVKVSNPTQIHQNYMRAEITKITNQKVSVELLDMYLNLNKDISDLKMCPEELIEIGKTYQRVKMNCDLNAINVDEYRRIIDQNQFKDFAIEFIDDNSIKFTKDQEPREVLLFVRKDDLEYKEISQVLRDEEFTFENSENSHEPENHKNQVKTLLEFFDNKSIEKSISVSNESISQFLNEMPPLLAKIDDIPLKIEKSKGKSWKKPEKIPNINIEHKCLIMEIDDDGTFGIILENQRQTLTDIKDIIKTVYGENYEPTNSNSKFIEGQSCIAYYTGSTGGYYRAKILRKIDDKDDLYEIEYIDYGTIRVVKSEEIHNSTICHEIPTLLHRIRLQGFIKTSYYNSLLQKMRENLSFEEATIKILEVNTDVDFEYVCAILFDQHWLKTYNDCHHKI